MSHAGADLSVRVTELVSPLTLNLDLLDPSDGVNALCANDALLFSGYGGLPGLLSASTLGSCAALCESMRAAIGHPHGEVIFSGCGTSGRLSQFHARTLNAAWASGCGSASARAHPPFSYILAGGDAALVLPQEAAEDSPSAALEGLAAWEAARAARGAPPGAPVVLVGITCGLSAPFVFSLLEAAMGRGAHWTPAIIGFNPIGAVRAVLPQAHATLVAMLEGGGRCHVVNPCLGPEAVAGSSRMKGGSATSIIVQTLAHTALAALASSSGSAPPAPCAPPPAALEACIEACLLDFSATVHRTYACRGGAGGGLAPLASAAGASLTSLSPASPTGWGRVVYLGVAGCGVLALTDASECPPTYGSMHDDIKGYLPGGFAALCGPERAQLLPPLPIPAHLLSPAAAAGAAAAAASPRLARVDLECEFLERCVPTLGPPDLVILVAMEGEGTSAEQAAALEGLRASAARGARVGHICVQQQRGGVPGWADFLAAVQAAAPMGLSLSLPSLGLRQGVEIAGGLEGAATTPAAPAAATVPPLPGLPCLGYLALKLCLNAVSTLAHVARGCIVKGRMVAMCISNSKLFHRAVGIIEDVAGGVGMAAAREALLHAIYEGSEAGLAAANGEAKARAEEVQRHVQVATKLRAVLPVAILLACGKSLGKALTPAHCRALLLKQPIPRKAIDSLRVNN